MPNPTNTPMMPPATGPSGDEALPIYIVDVYGNPIPSGAGSFIPSVNAGNHDATTQRVVQGGNPTSTVTQVGSAAVDTSLLAANAVRKGALFFNDSTATLFILYGTGVASATNYSVKIGPQAYFEDPLQYTGGYHGIWSAANGFVYCTEVS